MNLKGNETKTSTAKKTVRKNSISANLLNTTNMKSFDSATVTLSYDKRKKAVKVVEGNKRPVFFVFNDLGVSFELSSGKLKIGEFDLATPPISNSVFPVSDTVIPTIGWSHDDGNLIVGTYSENEGKTINTADVFIGVDPIRGNLGATIQIDNNGLSTTHAVVSGRIS